MAAKAIAWMEQIVPPLLLCPCPCGSRHGLDLLDASSSTSAGSDVVGDSVSFSWVTCFHLSAMGNILPMKPAANLLYNCLHDLDDVVDARTCCRGIVPRISSIHRTALTFLWPVACNSGISMGWPWSPLLPWRGQWALGPWNGDCSESVGCAGAVPRSDVENLVDAGANSGGLSPSVVWISFSRLA